MSYEPRPDEVLSELLAETKRQTRLLKSMNLVLQLWGLLLVLGIVGAGCYIVSMIASL